mmetsp:Transcript_5824/g.9315  ORF Transcript_5824/g.9315 Transcript_5824/m.9315 type:complete len:98 (+) Transcript_5824:2178-2471(+)
MAFKPKGLLMMDNSKILAEEQVPLPPLAKEEPPQLEEENVIPINEETVFQSKEPSSVITHDKIAKKSFGIQRLRTNENRSRDRSRTNKFHPVRTALT